MKVLSIDWDFFQKVSCETMRRCYPDGVDLPTAITEITWGGHYAADGDALHEVKLLQSEYEKLVTLLLNQNGEIPVMIANSHVHAYDFIKAHSDGEKIALLNIDTHHDMTPENKGLDCGNWILKLAQENLLDNSALGWIRNPISFEMYGIDGNGKDKFSKLLRRLDKGTSLDGIANEQYDLIFLARSDTWSPPHLDKYFCLLADIIKEHFTNITVESGITNPRTAYLQYAVTMQEQLASIRKERELA